MSAIYRPYHLSGVRPIEERSGLEPVDEAPRAGLEGAATRQHRCEECADVTSPPVTKTHPAARLRAAACADARNRRFHRRRYRQRDDLRVIPSLAERSLSRTAAVLVLRAPLPFPGEDAASLTSPVVVSRNRQAVSSSVGEVRPSPLCDRGDRRSRIRRAPRSGSREHAALRRCPVGLGHESAQNLPHEHAGMGARQESSIVSVDIGDCPQPQTIPVRELLPRALEDSGSELAKARTNRPPLATDREAWHDPVRARRGRDRAGCEVTSVERIPLGFAPGCHGRRIGRRQSQRFTATSGYIAIPVTGPYAERRPCHQLRLHGDAKKLQVLPGTGLARRGGQGSQCVSSTSPPSVAPPPRPHLLGEHRPAPRRSPRHDQDRRSRGHQLSPPTRSAALPTNASGSSRHASCDGACSSGCEPASCRHKAADVRSPIG